MSNLAGVVQQLKKERERAAKTVHQLDAALAALNPEHRITRTIRCSLCRWERDFLPTISDYFFNWEGVRLDVTGARKSSSYAKHCILLIRLEAGSRFKKIPLPAPALNKYIDLILLFWSLSNPRLHSPDSSRWLPVKSSPPKGCVLPFRVGMFQFVRERSATCYATAVFRNLSVRSHAVLAHAAS